MQLVIKSPLQQVQQGNLANVKDLIISGKVHFLSHLNPRPTYSVGRLHSEAHQIWSLPVCVNKVLSVVMFIQLHIVPGWLSCNPRQNRVVGTELHYYPSSQKYLSSGSSQKTLEYSVHQLPAVSFRFFIYKVSIIMILCTLHGRWGSKCGTVHRPFSRCLARNKHSHMLVLDSNPITSPLLTSRGPVRVSGLRPRVFKSILGPAFPYPTTPSVFPVLPPWPGDTFPVLALASSYSLLSPFGRLWTSWGQELHFVHLWIQRASALSTAGLQRVWASHGGLRISATSLRGNQDECPETGRLPVLWQVFWLLLLLLFGFTDVIHFMTSKLVVGSYILAPINMRAHKPSVHWRTLPPSKWDTEKPQITPMAADSDSNSFAWFHVLSLSRHADNHSFVKIKKKSCYQEASI